MRTMLRFILVFILISMLASCFYRDWELNEGIESFKAQDYRRAFIRLRPEAARGQPDAQYAVGYMYYYGQGVVEDRKKAWYWINMAAQAGQPDALAAKKILEQGSQGKKEIFQSEKLEHYPASKMLF